MSEEQAFWVMVAVTMVFCLLGAFINWTWFAGWALLCVASELKAMKDKMKP